MAEPTLSPDAAYDTLSDGSTFEAMTNRLAEVYRLLGQDPLAAGQLAGTYTQAPLSPPVDAEAGEDEAVTFVVSVPAVQKPPPNPSRELAVRRPVLGLAKPSRYRFAKIEVTRKGTGGERIPVVSSAVPVGRDLGVTNFIVQALSEGYTDPVAVQKSFGATYLSTSGTSDMQLNVGAYLFAAENFPWVAEWRFNYERFLRGQRCIQNNAEIVLTVDDVEYRGQMLNCELSRQNTMNGSWEVASLSFSMILTDVPRDVNPLRNLEGDDPFGTIAQTAPSATKVPDPLLKSTALSVPIVAPGGTLTREQRALSRQRQSAARQAWEAGHDVSGAQVGPQYKDTRAVYPDSGWNWLHESETLNGLDKGASLDGPVSLRLSGDVDLAGFQTTALERLRAALGLPEEPRDPKYPDLAAPSAIEAMANRRRDARAVRLEQEATDAAARAEAEKTRALRQAEANAQRAGAKDHASIDVV